MAATRMAKEERRRQLLETAFAIIRSEGTDALTLPRLAERAGVSRPVAYEHFQTREGLLMALYRDYDEQLGRRIREALQSDAAALEDAARALSTAYIDGVLAAGRECDEVKAALSGNETTRHFRQASQEFHVEQFRAAFAPFVDLSGRGDVALLVGVLSATDGLGQAAAAGEVARATAIAAATAIMVGALRSRGSRAPSEVASPTR